MNKKQLNDKCIADLSSFGASTNRLPSDFAALGVGVADAIAALNKFKLEDYRAALTRVSIAGRLSQYLEKLRLEIEQKERDRRWRDDPLQLKARCIDPVVEHFRAQSVELLETLLRGLKK
jgi:hypothetical protein